jgi:hypothetical protein
MNSLVLTIDRMLPDLLPAIGDPRQGWHLFLHKLRLQPTPVGPNRQDRPQQPRRGRSVCLHRAQAREQVHVRSGECSEPHNAAGSRQARFWFSREVSARLERKGLIKEHGGNTRRRGLYESLRTGP